MEKDEAFTLWFKSLEIVEANQFDEILAFLAWFKMNQNKDAEVLLVSHKVWKKLRLKINHLGQALIPTMKAHNYFISRVQVYKTCYITNFAAF